MHWSLYGACKQAVKVSMKTTEIQELIDFITKSGLEVQIEMEAIKIHVKRSMWPNS